MTWTVDITAEARARLHELYKTKLIQAEADLAAAKAKPSPEDPSQRLRHGTRVTVLTTRVADLRRKLEENGS